MRQGSAVHKTLEDQVHRTIPIEIRSKEDAWGLRIWNVIQGLKTLRETGMTRELEIWGLVHGQVVNGVIDELSYICPDKDLEEEAPAPADQSTIADFFKGPNEHNGVLKTLRSMRKKTDKIYLTDVKTRGVKTIPKGASFQPTLMQLMLYHLMLSDLVTGKVDPKILFARYELDTTTPFSDSFIAQIAALDEEEYHDAPASPTRSQSPPTSSPVPSQTSTSTPDPLSLLLAHNSLTSLWTLLHSQLTLTFPSGAASIGSVLKVEYRDQSDGSIIGLKTFLYDKDVISEYVDEEMRWWKGEREARGVEIEEAYKCRSCEFAEGCDWRRNKVEEAVRAVREREGLRGRERERSVV